MWKVRSVVLRHRRAIIPDDISLLCAIETGGNEENDVDRLVFFRGTHLRLVNQNRKVSVEAAITVSLMSLQGGRLTLTSGQLILDGGTQQ